MSIDVDRKHVDRVDCPRLPDMAPSGLPVARARPVVTRAAGGRGLVERRTGEADAREQHIHPTRAAEQIADALDAASAEVTRKLKQALGKQVFDQAVGQLRGIRAAIG